MHTLNDIITNMKALIASHDASAERNEQAAAHHEAAAAESRSLAAEARRNSDVLSDMLVVALARIDAPPPAPAPPEPATATEAPTDVGSGAAPLGKRHAKRPVHLPMPDGRQAKWAARLDADNREGTRALRALMASGAPIKVSDAVALFPPADNRQRQLTSWMGRQGWTCDRMSAGAVYRPMTPGSKVHAAWLACVGRLA